MSKTEDLNRLLDCYKTKTGLIAQIRWTNLNDGNLYPDYKREGVGFYILGYNRIGDKFYDDAQYLGRTYDRAKNELEEIIRDDILVKREWITIHNRPMLIRGHGHGQ